jgi:hypothetical protein
MCSTTYKCVNCDFTSTKINLHQKILLSNVLKVCFSFFIDMREKMGVQVFSEHGIKKQLVVCYPELTLLAGKNFGESFVQIFCFIMNFFSFQPANTTSTAIL